MCKSGSESSMVENVSEITAYSSRCVGMNRDVTHALAERILASQERLNCLGKNKRDMAPDISKIYSALPASRNHPGRVSPCSRFIHNLGGELGKVLHYFNKLSGGAFLTSAGYFLGSTSVMILPKISATAITTPSANPYSRTLLHRWHCEDAMSGVASGISKFGCI